jgi:hypothetical protein
MLADDPGPTVVVGLSRSLSLRDVIMSRKNKAPQEGLFPNGQPQEALDAVGSVGPTDQGEAAEPEEVHPEDLEFAVEELDGADSPPARLPRPSSITSGVAGDDGGTLEQPWPNAAAAPDPFDPGTLRLSQSFGAAAGVKKALLTVPVRKPDKSWFVRVHPDESYRLQTAVIELKEDRETYLVVPALWPELATEATFRPKLLATAVNRQGVVFLWEANLPRSDGRVDEWTRTALEAVELSTRR